MQLSIRKQNTGMQPCLLTYFCAHNVLEMCRGVCPRVLGPSAPTRLKPRIPTYCSCSRPRRSSTPSRSLRFIVALLRVPGMKREENRTQLLRTTCCCWVGRRSLRSRLARQKTQPTEGPYGRSAQPINRFLLRPPCAGTAPQVQARNGRDTYPTDSPSTPGFGHKGLPGR